MDKILTLICHPNQPCLSADLLGQVRLALSPKAEKLLSPGVAIEFYSDRNEAEIKGILLPLLADLPIDTAIQSSERPKIDVFLADMDSTIIEQECLDELANYAGVGEKIAAITERAMRGDLDFEAALRERVGMLKGLPASALQQTLNDKISLMPGARTLVRTLNARGVFTALVSGGFTFFTHRIAQIVGFQDNQGNVLEVTDGVLTGSVEPPIFGREAKFEALKRYCEELGVDASHAMAVGDGANDLAMLKAAAIGVAYHAKPIVAEAARFQINHADLTALLYLQGISDVEFLQA